MLFFKRVFTVQRLNSDGSLDSGELGETIISDKNDGCLDVKMEDIGTLACDEHNTENSRLSNDI